MGILSCQGDMIILCQRIVDKRKVVDLGKVVRALSIHRVVDCTQDDIIALIQLVRQTMNGLHRGWRS